MKIGPSEASNNHNPSFEIIKGQNHQGNSICHLVGKCGDGQEERWEMCIDYTKLNKHYPKDLFPLLKIDRLVESSFGYDLLSFMDPYLGYNQIPTYPLDKEKTTFIIDQGIFCYTMMPFGLENARATYQCMMTKVFDGMIGKKVEVYIDDIIAKTPRGRHHILD